MRPRLRVGIAGALKAVTTPHGVTFLRALATALNTLPQFAGLELLFGDDEARGERAAEVARGFAASRIQAVLGPFGSDCLLAAANIYEDAQIPMVTPAATVCLDQEYSTIFRLCTNDESIAALMTARILSRGVRRVTVLSDESNHCQRLKRAIERLLLEDGIQLRSGLDQSDLVVFTGRLRASRAFLKQFRDSGAELPLLMTDDAAACDLVQGTANTGDLEVLGFPAAHQITTARADVSRYLATYGTLPIYALETMAAAAVIAQAVATGEPLAALRRDTFSTALGPIRFAKGERRDAVLAWWRPSEGYGLAPVELVPCPTKTTDPVN
jgi:ABC-type branched-subunit amino acid transport system substrate-binding protein